MGSADRRAAAVQALQKDVAGRNYHLTVGSVEQKWPLRTLNDSEEGLHDTALKVAVQDTLPSWGYWFRQAKALPSACWENWLGVPDAHEGLVHAHPQVEPHIPLRRGRHGE
jgi:hypothetical protein